MTRDISGVCAIVPRHQVGIRPKVIGMGILIDDREMVTCAHVVDAAIGEGWFAEPGEGVVRVCFPFAEEAIYLDGTVDRKRYFRPDRAEEGRLTDIAVVRLSKPAPATARRAVLRGHVVDASVKVFGVRRKDLDNGGWESHPDGEIVESKVLGKLPGGRVYFEGLRSTGAAVEPGFSGAGVYDAGQGAVVGMVVKASAEPGRNNAQFIDVPSLLQAIGRPLVRGYRSRRLLEAQTRRDRIPLQRPLRPEHFTGRKKELSRLQNDLQPGKVVTICGLGGVGKTALAVELVWALAPDDDPPEQFPDGIVFYSFSDQRTAELALVAIARAFGEDPGQDPPNLAAQRALEGRTALLVLDAVENADDIRSILDLCAGCGVLLTSRERNRGERDLRDTRALPIAQAVRLLQALSAEYIDDATAAREICKLVGGLPLAIRLAGHYMRTGKVYATEYLQWLKQSPLSALHHGQRQQDSVPLLISRTLEQLSERAREMLAVGGLLALAPFGADVVEVALALPSPGRTRALGELVNNGLLSRDKQGYEVCHALVHAYARERLSVPREVLERLARHFTDHPRRLGGSRATGNDEIDEVRPHITALLPRLWESSLSECAVDLVRKLVPPGESFLHIRGYWGDEAGHLTRALEVCAEAGPQRGAHNHQLWPRRTAELNEALGDLFFSKDEYETAECALRRSLSVYSQLRDTRPEQARTKLKLAEIALNKGNFDEVFQLLEGVPEECRELPQQSGTIALAHSILGRANHGKEVYSQADAHYLQSLAHYQNAIHGAERARVLVRLSSLRFDQCRDEEAAAYLREAEECLTSANDSLRSLARVRGDIASHYLWRKDYKKAGNLNEQTLKDFRRIGDPQFIGWTLQRQGDIHFEQGSGHDAKATTAYTQALRIFEELGILNGQAYSLDHLAQIKLRSCKYMEAKDLFKKALDRFDRSGVRSGKGYVHGNLGDLAQLEGDREAAREHYRIALSIWKELYHSKWIAITEEKLTRLG